MSQINPNIGLRLAPAEYYDSLYPAGAKRKPSLDSNANR